MKDKNAKILICIIVIIICLLPLALGLIYRLPFPQLIPIDLGDLLVYYATAFAIPASIVVLVLTNKYENELKEKEKEDLLDKEVNDNKPHFIVKIEKTNNYFNIIISGCEKGKYRNIYFYDNRIADIWAHENYKYRVCFDSEEEEIEKMPSNTIALDTYDGCDDDGLPSFFCIVCEYSKIGAIYMSSYEKKEIANDVLYEETDVEVIDWR